MPTAMSESGPFSMQVLHHVSMYLSSSSVYHPLNRAISVLDVFIYILRICFGRCIKVDMAVSSPTKTVAGFSHLETGHRRRRASSLKGRHA